MNKSSLSTSSFKEIIVFIVKLGLFCLFAFLYINHVLPQYSGEYNAALIDKVERLKSINEPKIVLIGNSNLSFGIDSELLEKEIGMPVVNMGLHGGLGNAFHEEMARYKVNKGDVYIICHTDFSDDDSISDAVLAWITIENHYELWKILRIKDLYTMAKGFPIYLKKCLDLYVTGEGNADNGGLSRSAFNQYGDIGILREGSEYTFTDKVTCPKISPITVKRLNKLNKYLESKGAVMLVAGYPIGKGELTDDIQKYEEFTEELREQLDCDVISDYSDYMFEYNYFYNSYLHLNTEGAKIRTEQLIEDIKQWRKHNSA